MKTRLIIFTCLFLSAANLLCAENDLKEQAMAAFRNGDYRRAIELLEIAKKENPKDPQVYYYLGYFSHYMAYDSRPLIGYDEDYSDKVLQYLNKAIALNAELGDAYYFISAEYGARADHALQMNDAQEYILAYQTAYAKKAFPKWLLEYGKNILKSCDQHAIVFVGGDAERNPIQYLQVVENYRKDVTVIPMALLERPWYVKKLRSGFENILTKVPISLSEAQILDMHPYKWDTLTIEIEISPELKERYDLSSNAKMTWQLKPDLKSEQRAYLSAGRAILANIIETNVWQRPVYFSPGCSPTAFAGLDNYFQLSGFVYQLLPVKTRNTEHEIDPEKIERILLVKENLRDLKDVDRHNMPRVSNIVLNYYAVLSRLVNYYSQRNQTQKIAEIVDFMKKQMNVEVLPQAGRFIESVEKQIQE